MSAEIRKARPEAEVELIRGGKGIFDVKVDGKMVFSKYEVGRHANKGELAGLLAGG